MSGRDERRTLTEETDHHRFAIEAVPPRAAPGADAGFRILVDGVRLPTGDLHHGVAPDLLGRLAATHEPHEALIADRDCVPECCGGLYVTVERDGGSVRWSGWRPARADQPRVTIPELRFGAGEYDAELARAMADMSWEWPARTVARLVNTALSAEPNLLGRWGCGHAHARSDASEPGRLTVRFVHLAPAGALTFEDTFTVADHPRPVPEEVLRLAAAEIVGRLTERDPKPHTPIRRGSRRVAAGLGLVHPGR